MFEQSSRSDRGLGGMSDLVDLEMRLDRATTQLLPELRATKVLNQPAVVELLQVADGLAIHLGDADAVPRELVGKLWFVFTAMLAEADHTPAPGAILDVAWDYEDRLEKIFGPPF